MPEYFWIAFFTALPPTLVALGGFIVSVMNSWKAEKIHVLVNSNMTKVQADLALANQRIEELATALVSATHSKL
jgi:hypothetical protein